MVATLGGLLALPLGLLILLLPLLATELSRPRDSAWGAVVLLLALVLVTSADRLSGAPMLGVVCAALLIGRLGVEVGRGRWRQLTPEEQRRLASLERWTTSFSQLGATLADAGRQLGTAAAGLGQGLGNATARASHGGDPPTGAAGGRSRGKLWVRPEEPAELQATSAAPEERPPSAEVPAAAREPEAGANPTAATPAAPRTASSDPSEPLTTSPPPERPEPRAGAEAALQPAEIPEPPAGPETAADPAVAGAPRLAALETPPETPAAAQAAGAEAFQTDPSAPAEPAASQS